MTLPTPKGGGFYHTLALADPAGSGATLTGTDVSHPVVARLRMWMAALWSRARLRPQPSQKVLYNMNLYNAPERERLISPCLKAGALRRYPVTRHCPAVIESDSGREYGCALTALLYAFKLSRCVAP